MGLYVTAYYASNSLSLVGTGGLMASLEWRDAYLVMALASSVGCPCLSASQTPSRSTFGRIDRTPRPGGAEKPYGALLHPGLLAARLGALRRQSLAPRLPGRRARRQGVDGEQAVVRAAAVGRIALAAGALGPVMGGAVSDRWGRATSASLIFALSGACSFVIGWMGGFPWAVIVVLAIVYGWAISADSAIYSTAITEVAEECAPRLHHGIASLSRL